MQAHQGRKKLVRKMENNQLILCFMKNLNIVIEISLVYSSENFEFFSSNACETCFYWELVRKRAAQKTFVAYFYKWVGMNMAMQVLHQLKIHSEYKKQGCNYYIASGSGDIINSIHMFLMSKRPSRCKNMTNLEWFYWRYLK